MRRNLKAEKKRKSDRAHLAEELERRVMLSAAVAAFAPQVTLGVGTQPRAVVMADVNLDGKLDLVVTNGAGNSVGVLLGNGSGGFGAQTTFATGTTPFGVAVGDVNRDGKPDLVVANNGSGNVSVLLGNGNGTFGNQTQLAAGTQARFVAVGDVNGDGKPDLVVANYGAGTVSVLVGNGNGTFGGQVAVGAGSQPSSIAVGDFNRDGKVDLAVADKSGGTVSVLIGNGNGSFGGASAISTGSGSKPFSISSGDVNGDGKLDLLAAEETSGVVGVMLGNGNGTFGGQTTFAAGAIACAVVVGDVNGDGRLDIATANYSSNSVSVLVGNGNGSFQGQKTFGVGTNPFSLAAGDVNRDGRLDLVAGNFGGSNVSLLLGDALPYVVSINRSNPSTQSTSASSVTYVVTFNEAVTGVDATDFALALSGVTATTPVVVSGSGTNYTVTVNGISGNGTLGLNLVDDGSIKDSAGNSLASASGYVLQGQQTFSSGPKPYASAVADLDGDGKLDLVTTNARALSAVSVALGNGNGTFKASKSFATVTFPKAVAIGDVNRDGRPDLVVADSANAVSVLVGNGDGTFGPQVTYAVSNDPYSVAVIDLNGDGVLDLAVADNFGGVSILLGNTNGTFGPEKTFAAGTSPTAVFAVDLNRDGKLDLAVANGIDHDVSVLLGNGDGSFQGQLTLAAGTYDSSVAAGDVDGDGKVDLVVGNNYFASPGSVSVLLGNGNGTFLPQQTIVAGPGPTGVVLRDLNSDGRLDIAVSDFGNSEAAGSCVSVMLGNGNGTFLGRQTIGSGAGPRSIVAGDLNGDGLVDVVVCNTTAGNEGALLSAVSGNFSGQSYTVVQQQSVLISFLPQQTLGAVQFPSSIATGDLNGDGKVDLVVTGLSVSTFGVLLGTGDGTFGACQTYSLPGSGFAAVVSDVNNDGRGDVVVMKAGASSGLACVMLGNGDGTLAAPLTFAVGVTPKSVKAADVNGDGKKDLIATNFFSNSVSVLLGNGDGTFAGQQTYGTGVSPYGVSVGDLNGDGHMDMVVANGKYNSTTVGVFVGNGDGTFKAQQTFTTNAQSPHSVAISDVTGDGKPDLLVANANSYWVSVLQGNGNGTFQFVRTLDVGTSPVSVVAADVNGDGKPDLVVGRIGNYTSVLLGNGNGTFAGKRTFGVGGSGYSVAVADVNRDGRLDIVSANNSDSNVSVLLNDPPPVVLSIDRSSPMGPITGSTSVTFTVTFSEAVTGVDSTDFVVATKGVTVGGPISVSGSGGVYNVTGAGLSGTGTYGLNLVDDGTIKDATGLALGPGGVAAFAAPLSTDGGIYPEIVAISDLNLDGRPDFVTTTGNFNAVWVHMGNGNGTFLEHSVGLSQSVAAATLSDVNGDGKADFVFSDQIDLTVNVMLGNGDGTFKPQMTSALSPVPWAMACADMNGDGRMDVVVANTPFNTPGTVSVMLGNGDGTFKPPMTFTTGVTPVSLVLADVNGDGKLDVATSNAGDRYPGNTVSVLLGNGDGTLASQATYLTGVGPRTVAAGDLNRDGRMDLVVGNTRDSTLSVLLGNGDGTFAAQQTILAIEPTSVVVVDMNEDGKPDVLVQNGSSTLVVLLGKGDGTFGGRQTFDSTGLMPRAMAVADFNGDGRPDVVTANYSSDTASVLLGLGNGNFLGQVYEKPATSDSIFGSVNINHVTLSRDEDGQDIDWQMDDSFGQLPAADPNGLTINGVGGNDLITLDYSHGNPLPSILHLNGVFTIDNLEGANPLAGVTFDIGPSVVWLTYTPGASPISTVIQYLRNGYNGGGWNGMPTASTGVIESSTASAGAAGRYGVGYADWADGIIAGQQANTIQLVFTAMGDTNLDRLVDSTDALVMTRNYLVAGKTTWDQGNFNYDGVIDYSDALLLQQNFKVRAPGVSLVAPGTTAEAVNTGVVTVTDGDLLGTKNVKREKKRHGH